MYILDKINVTLQTVDLGGSRGQLGPRYPSDQHPVPEGSSHAGLRQGVEGEDRLQTTPGWYSYRKSLGQFNLRYFQLHINSGPC